MQDNSILFYWKYNTFFGKSSGVFVYLYHFTQLFTSWLDFWMDWAADANDILRPLEYEHKKERLSFRVYTAYFVFSLLCYLMSSPALRNILITFVLKKTCFLGISFLLEFKNNNQSYYCILQNPSDILITRF